MSNKSWFEEKIEILGNDVEFLTEEKILEFTERVVLEMGKKNITRVQLANALGSSKPFVSKLLKGNANMTVKTMVAVAHALGCNLHLDLYPKGFKARTFSVSPDFTPVEIDYTDLELHDACAA